MKKQKRTDYWVDGRRAKMEPILRSWTSIIKSFSDSNRYKGDHLYWYNERASLSSFAGAFYSQKNKSNSCFALEEYRETKGRGRGKWNGRVDMWFNLDNKDYVVEAKQNWISITNKLEIKRITKSISTSLREAKDDATKSAQVNDGISPIGISFIVPYCKKKEHDGFNDETGKKINEIINVIENDIDCFGCAYVFPENGLLTENMGGYIYPGVILLMGSPK